MKPTPGRFARAAVPVRALLQRFGLLVFAALAATLMAVDRSELEAARQVRVAVADAAAPVLDVLSRPVESLGAAAAEVRALLDLRAENAALRETVERLRHWEIAARRLERENVALRGMTHLTTDSLPVFVTARAVGDSGSPFARTLLVNAGVRDGVAAGQAAMTADGLIGRVVEAGHRASRILLITDLNSRIPVALDGTRRRAVLAGDNSGMPRLVFLPRDSRMAAGERVATSGDAGVLPPGLPVGAVAEVSDDAIRVRPAADLGRIDYVRLVAWTPPAFEMAAGAAP